MTGSARTNGNAEQASSAPEIKFVLVATAGAAACFTAGYALTRVPGISKVL